MSEMECSSDDKSSTGSLWPKTHDAESRKLLYWCEITITIIPSFSYIMVELRHVKIRWWNPMTKRHCDYVVFIQEDAAICNVGPATAVV